MKNAPHNIAEGSTAKAYLESDTLPVNTRAVKDWLEMAGLRLQLVVSAISALATWAMLGATLAGAR